MKKHSVRLIKLTSGEEVLAMYINSHDDTLEILEPISVVATGSLMRPKIVFNRFSIFSRWDQSVHITQSHIVTVTEPTKQVSKFYHKLRKFVKHVFNEQINDEIITDTENLGKFFSNDSVSQDAIYQHFLEQLPFPKGPPN